MSHYRTRNTMKKFLTKATNLFDIRRLFTILTIYLQAYCCFLIHPCLPKDAHNSSMQAALYGWYNFAAIENKIENHESRISKA